MTISQAESTNYTAGSKDITVTVNPIDPNFNIGKEAVEITGTASTDVEYASESDGAITIKTAPDAVIATATLSDGKVTITGVAPGTTSVVLTQAADGLYKAADKTINITVKAAESTTTTWDFSTYTTQTSADIADYNGLKIVLNGGGTNDYVTSSGAHFNGASSSSIRYIKYTPSADGTLKVTFSSNNSSKASERNTYIGTTLANTSSYLAKESASTGSVSASLTASTTYYVYVDGGITITKLEYTTGSATTYAVTYSSAHGTAPSGTTAASVTLPTLTEDGYTNTGWTADKATTVSGSNVAAGTTIACGSVVTLSEATTFTAVWEETPTYDEKGTKYTFDATKRYSQWVINSRLNDFYANTTHVGFGVFDDSGTKTTTEVGTKSNLDYVPGLVAKAVLEAVDYYKDNSSIDVKPWYYAIQYYGNYYDITSNGKAGKSFDDLNAVKIYSKLLEFGKNKTFADGAVYTNAQTVTNANARFASALSGISTANTSYAISSTTNANAAGGWWHKASYDNQMWCDGQYMGPALLAQMINDYGSYSQVASSDTDWDLITKQLNISWNYLWNDDTKLLYHAFSATPSASTSSCWATLACPYDETCSTNTAYWGRADGWYMFALVDILEQMDKANISKTDANYVSLRTKLNTLAAGIAARQDATSGCWYQLLDKDDTYSSNGTSNYLESSASAIFTAAFLKGMRLGYFDTNYYPVATKAYEGFVNQFMVADGTGGVNIIGTCRSAGLGGSNSRKGDYDYYLNGSDVSKTTDVTEGKVLGAFIMAATEYERMFMDVTSVEAKVASGRTFGSFSSIYNVDFSDASNTDIIAAYTVKYNGSDKVTLTRHRDVLPAGTGVVLYAPTDTKSQTFATASSADGVTVADNDMVGVPVATAVAASVDKSGTTYYNYGLSADAFHPISAGTIPAGKAYLSIARNPSSSSAKAIALSFDDGLPTGINEVQEGVSIFGDGKIYNLQGIEVSKPENGKIYIVNGKKFMMQ